MVSEFRKKKFLYLFKIMFNGDETSTIERKDFEASIGYVAKIQGWEKDGKLEKEVRETEAKFWNGISKSGDKVTADKWVAMWDVQGDLPDWQNLFCRLNFLIQDPSRDGVIDKEEYVKVHKAFGIPEGEATEAFEKMSQGKATINWDDFQKLFKEYVQSEDVNAPGNYMFGTRKFIQ